MLGVEPVRAGKLHAFISLVHRDPEISRVFCLGKNAAEPAVRQRFDFIGRRASAGQKGETYADTKIFNWFSTWSYVAMPCS